MSTTFSAPAAAHGMPEQALICSPVAILRRWWTAYLTRRIEQAAIAQLSLMSDRALKDIGLTRSQIPYAVTGAPGHHRFSHHC